VAYSIASAHISTTRDYLLALKRYSGCDVSYVNVTHGGAPDFDLNEFDVVFQNYCSRLCFKDYVTPAFQEALAAFKGLKIMAVQDEYDHTFELRAAILRCGFDIVLSAAQPSDHDYIYDASNSPTVQYKHVLTGYAPDPADLPKPCYARLEDRPITIGYRGRDIGARYGLLGYYKYEIGRRMAMECQARGIVHDIETSEEARIYGTAWFDFIGSCRVMLGTESGSNVFDFDGSIVARYQEFKANGHQSAISYEAFLPQVADLEARVGMSEISPRIFECAAMGTPMVLFPGRYSDILIPGRHYIVLEKDFSNLDEVLSKIEDIPALKRMADQAYEDLIAAGTYSYKAYANFIKDIIAANPRQRAKPQSGATLGTSPQLISGPGAEAPTPEPLAQNAYQIRQWGWLTPQIPGERNVIIEQSIKAQKACMDRSRAFEAVCRDLDLARPELSKAWSNFYATVEVCASLKAIADTYVPDGPRAIDFEVGYFYDTSNRLQVAFGALQTAIDPYLPPPQKSQPLALNNTPVAAATNALFSRARLKAVLSHVPLVARITNRYL
jgi:Glycosyl transferases group 1